MDSLSGLAIFGVLAPIDVVHTSILIIVYKTLGRCYDDQLKERFVESCDICSLL